METDKIRLSTLILSLTGLIVLETVFALTNSGKNAFSLIRLGGLRLLETGFWLLVIRFQEDGMNAIGLGKADLLPGIKAGGIWSLAFAAAAGFCAASLWLLGFQPLQMIRIALPTSPDRILIFLLVGGVLGPIAEEIFFRGILYGYFRKWGILPALIISTGIFVSLHSGFGITQIIGGLVFALAYEKEKALSAPIVIHVAGNLALFSISLLQSVIPVSAFPCL